MKVLYILIIVSLILLGCVEPEAPLEPDNIVKYTVDSDIADLTADIWYCDEKSVILSIDGESLPWSIEIVPDSESRGTAYLKAIIPEAVAFVPFVTGTNTDIDETYLIDTEKNFIASGVSSGDIIYKNIGDPFGVEIDEVESEHRLKLKKHDFEYINQSYFIYHLIELNVAILHNDEVLIEKTVEGYKRLEELVQTSIDR